MVSGFRLGARLAVLAQGVAAIRDAICFQDVSLAAPVRRIVAWITAGSPWPCSAPCAKAPPPVRQC
ncbi:hypothetical protein QJS66_15530 [Kocuria rhizophila]|nr:hypothetical protein QJS66_15530 [Kocuria rhizophila]